MPPISSSIVSFSFCCWSKDFSSIKTSLWSKEGRFEILSSSKHSITDPCLFSVSFAFASTVLCKSWWADAVI